MTALALTVLLIVLWIGCIALGYWHGGWRQIIVLAAVLLSYAVTSEWAAPNGHDLSQQFHWNAARTTTAVGLLYLLGGTLVMGGLGSFALGRPVPLSLRERILGGAMGVLNGGLLLALVLRTLRAYAFAAGSGQVLRQSALSRFLIEEIGYVLIATLAVGSIAAVAGFFLNWRREESEESAVYVPQPETQPVLPQPQYMPAPQPQAVPVPASPVSVAPPIPEPIFATAPIIDWPSSPPPGTPDEPAAVVPTGQPAAITAAPAEESRQRDATKPDGRALVPTALTLPRRVEPPMRYPIEALTARQLAPPATVTPIVPRSAAPAASMQPAPPTAEMPPAAPANVPPGRPPPTTPPPGALQPAFVPPTTPSSAPAPVSSRAEPAVATSDEPVASASEATTEKPSPLTVHESSETMEEPPIVREVEVPTRDVPILPAIESGPEPAAPPSPADDARTQVPNPPLSPSPLPAVPPPRLPDIPAPSSPDVSPPVAQRPMPSPEAPKPRSGFARVAVVRQAGGGPEQPPPAAPQAPAELEPLQPPLPAGPRVHPCPACGYPVRDHARYCPNCGNRQRS